MSLLVLQNISKRYDFAPAVKDVSLEIAPGEFFGLLGPSGCGKTTTLRLIAGLEKPDSGAIEFDGHDITNLPPEARGFGMVFQNYALFPHLNVFENVAFGLRARRARPASGGDRVTQPDIKDKVNRALDLVQLPGYEKRSVGELSGGQQQRVAIARAIAIEPSLLLFDEPLSNLDVTLREETRGELRQLVNRLGLTALYVTHDQEEAFALCDRISVMVAGELLQTDAPRALYERPARLSVARFLGRNNLIRAMRVSAMKNAAGEFKTLEGGHTLRLPVDAGQLPPVNQPCILAIRPEHVVIARQPGQHENELTAHVREINFSGATSTIKLDAQGLMIEALALSAEGVSIGDMRAIVLAPNRITLLEG